jgi:hypothetical protein
VGDAVSGLFDNAEHWGGLARKIRAQAEFLVDPYNKRTLLLIAQSYDTMAERAKRRIGEKPKDECA